MQCFNSTAGYNESRTNIASMIFGKTFNNENPNPFPVHFVNEIVTIVVLSFQGKKNQAFRETQLSCIGYNISDREVSGTCEFPFYNRGNI